MECFWNSSTVLNKINPTSSLSFSLSKDAEALQFPALVSGMNYAIVFWLSGRHNQETILGITQGQSDRPNMVSGLFPFND